ncbi:f-box-like domain-containing protein [Sarocladium implicatum]|nr:f-box-like domain-containing protein [Sarocladium implicatum]
MPSFTDIPTELLLSILQHTSSSKDQLHAGLTCKKLHQVANGLIYAAISLDWSSTRETAPNSVTLLLRSLMEKPQLGVLVKDLHLHGRDFISVIAWNILTPPVFVGALDLANVASVIRGFQLQHAQEWEEKARQGKMDAIVTLLLTFLPNLTRLRMLSNFAKETRILALTLLSDIKESSCNKAVLPMRYSLEDVTISRHRQGSDKVKEDNMSEILLWFYLPKIRLLNLSIDNPETFAWPLDYSPYPSLLRSLTLTILRESHAKKVLAVCNGLKYLDWTLEYTVDRTDMSGPMFDLDGIRIALGPLRQSLEVLMLTAAISMGVSEIDFPLVYVQGSLAIADFPAVRKLTLSWPFAMGLEPNRERRMSDSIPKNVREITITSDGFDRTESFEWDEFTMLGPLEEFLTGCKKRTPFLKQLNLVVEFLAAPVASTNKRQAADPLGGVADAGQNAVTEFFKLGDAVLNLPGDAVGKAMEGDPAGAMTGLVDSVAKSASDIPGDAMGIVAPLVGGGK